MVTPKNFTHFTIPAHLSLPISCIGLLYSMLWPKIGKPIPSFHQGWPKSFILEQPRLEAGNTYKMKADQFDYLFDKMMS